MTQFTDAEIAEQRRQKIIELEAQVEVLTTELGETENERDFARERLEGHLRTTKDLEQRIPLLAERIAELEETNRNNIMSKDAQISELIEALREINVRIAYIGMPSEPEDWRVEIKLIQRLLLVHDNGQAQLVPVEQTDWGVARYKDDDREGYELIIMRDEQGDLYISVLPEGHKIGPKVRLCASGGASSRCPRLRRALFHAYDSMLQYNELHGG